VVIATPDHWHHRMTLDALDAGKHVYVEKPMTWSIEQGREVVAAVQKSGKLLMVGSGAKTSALTAKAREIVKSGVLGKVNMVRMLNHRNNPEGAWVYPIPPDASPRTVDWARFLGPAPKRAYDPKVFFRWRCWWEYSGGVATDLIRARAFAAPRGDGRGRTELSGLAGRHLPLG
jgi:Predicted dehydrogenases and related proteins